MAGLNVGDVIECAVLGTIFNQKTVTLFHYKITVDSGEPNTVTALQKWASDWKAGAVSPFLSFLACCPTQWQCDGIRVQRIAPVRSIGYYQPYNQPGTDGVTTTSTNQAASVTKGSQVAGRKEIGRIQIPGLAQGNMVGGKIAPAFLTKMSTLGSKMLNLFLAASDPTLAGFPVLVHRTKVVLPSGKTRYVFAGTSDLFRTIPQDTARVMRRRTVGVGK